MASDPRAAARDKVLFQLQMKGPRSAAQLARRLAITPAAVRMHLQALEGEGLVAAEEERRGVGRPTRVWRTTERAAGRFPDTHAELTVDLLGALRDVFGADAVARLAHERTRRQALAYRARVGARRPLAERVAALAAIRREEGYLAEWSRASDGAFLLVENHCPICAAARACQALCSEELALFAEVLGRDVRVERVEHLLSGARRCAYRIAPRARAAS